MFKSLLVAGNQPCWIFAIQLFLENMIRGESIKIVKDEISEFLRLEFPQNHRPLCLKFLNYVSQMVSFDSWGSLAVRHRVR